MTRFSNDYHNSNGGEASGSMSEKFLHATRKTPASASMLSSAKFRFREDRKRVLKLSVRKLRDIEDPETFLCRSVLINNTMKRLQQEVRDEKKSSAASNACKSYTPSPYSYYSVERAYREEMERVHTMQDESSNHRRSNSVNDHDDDMTSSASSSGSSGSSDEEEEEKEHREVNNGLCSSLNSNDDVDDLLSEVYMPPSITPPTMISSIDDDDLTTYPSIDHVKGSDSKDSVASELCWPDRPSTPIPWAPLTSSCTERSCDIWCCHLWPNNTTSTTSSTTTMSVSASASSSSSSSTTTSCDSFMSSTSSTYSSWSNYSELSPSCNSSNNNTTTTTPAAAASTSAQSTAPTTFTSSSYSICGGASYLSDKGLSDKHYSCGQSSLFGELQSVVFNSLIASLET